LHIITRATVSKVLFRHFNNERKPRAHKVHFIHNGIQNEIVANREIILSAGAINTPQILMLSGKNFEF
jgi:choline dehydrogenase-like flavoprotein